MNLKNSGNTLDCAILQIASLICRRLSALTIFTAAFLAAAPAFAVESDIVWQNTAGERVFWLMNGTNIISGQRVSVVEPEWQISATGDFNADGKPDLIWQNTVTGERAVWFMDGTNILSGKSLGYVEIAWQIVTAGDFNADGKQDLIWQNSDSGERAIWLMDGTTRGSGVSLGYVAKEWQIVGAGDFDGDSKPDLVWQNGVTGERAVWFMNGIGYKGGSRIALLETAWQIAAIGDFNNDGKPDLVWQNINGDRAIWLMSGVNPIGAISLGNVSTNWKIAATVPITRELQLFSVPSSNCFFDCVERKLSLPYASSGSASYSCLGSGCPANFEIAAYKLQAEGLSYTVTDLKAENLTSGSSVTPLISGLSNGQAVAAGQSVTFRLQSPSTGGARLNLRYSFRILETGQTFAYSVNLQTN